MRRYIKSKKGYWLYTKLTVLLLLLSNAQLFCLSNLEENKYNVGFRYYKVFDTTRLYYNNQDTTFRPLLINFWYPSKVKSDTSEYEL